MSSRESANQAHAAARRFVAIGIGGLLLAAAPAAATTRFTLPQLLDLVRRHNPGLRAGGESTAAIEAQLVEARRSWMPTGELLSLLAPSPEIRCFPSPNECNSTNVSDASVNLKGVFTRTEVRLTQPLYTFGKINAGIAAAEAGVEAARRREDMTRAELEANVSKGYFGLKLAREIGATLEEGLGYVDEAQKRIEKEVAEGTGTATVSDKLRLRTVRAEIDARALEARRMGDLARGGLRALVGPDAPADLDVDDEPLESPEIPARPLPHYQEMARLSRPEVGMLDRFVFAKRALADLERLKLYPDLVLVGSATYAYASSIDNPKNAFANDPFNTLSAGLAAALRVPLDIGPKDARARRARAEANEIEFRRREALSGITLEVEKAWGELSEATERLKVLTKGEKAAKSWITAVAQNLAVGLSETRDFADALTAFFQMRLRYLQAVFDVNAARVALERATGGVVAATPQQSGPS